MFTGIVEETGVVETVQPSARSIQLVARARVCARGLKMGDSLAVNGCCLTVARRVSRSKHTLIHFDQLRETWDRTNLRAHVKQLGKSWIFCAELIDPT